MGNSSDLEPAGVDEDSLSSELERQSSRKPDLLVRGERILPIRLLQSAQTGETWENFINIV